ncbi:HAD-IIA family hydrolase [Pseudonocardia sp. TRM90224]|uniref:HAD-IIA family hydrolase n=1 Tax=Pseudonocardia sp. TRM90224 TaxID=2812678 RepID=UPI001E3E9619|nr:HAD-IIA family hydrolase [Pseudonocardia sp. TRM90224]
MTDLLDLHDVLLADLDGTLYAGPTAVPGALDAVQHAAKRGVRTVYVTNNASRRPSDVAEHLRELGFPAADADVATSSQAAAAMLAGQLPQGAPVLVVGTAALAAEVTAVGLGVTDRTEEAVAVVQGHSPDTGWRVLAEATVALRAGAVWVACNLDPTLPTERGPLPGNGSMVQVLRTSSGREPQVAGKPAPALLLDAVRRNDAQRPLILGDRLDTDIEGGHAAGIPSLLVLTGVSGPADVLAAEPDLRPDYIGADLGALTATPEALAPGPKDGWSVEPDGDALVLRGEGDPLDALRALCAARWERGSGPVDVRADGPGAADALRALGIGGDSPSSATVDRENQPRSPEQ